MLMRIAALAALVMTSCLPAPALSRDVLDSPLTLDDAFARVAHRHPDLQLLGARQAVLLAERETALLRPPIHAAVDVENALGNGDLRGFRSAEITLSLAGVFERGGKLDARRTLAQSRIDALAMQREMQRLDLLADVARRYLAVQAARTEAAIAQRDIEQRRRTVNAARQRLQAGASPESVVLNAQAALARAEMARERARQQEDATRRHLAALWGDRNPTFTVVDADPLRLPEIAPLDVLAELLRETPELMQIADLQRIGEARVRLARSNATPDLDWRIGVRRLQASDDTALVGSLSVALGARSRAQSEIRTAEADMAVLDLEHESRDIALYATLVDAHGRYHVARIEVERTTAEILPRLFRAEQAAERAYRAGAISYLEWAQLQADTIAAQRQQLAAALDAQRALIELQRLTGASLLAGSASTAEGTPP